jgi:hypothetical protein
MAQFPCVVQVSNSVAPSLLRRRFHPSLPFTSCCPVQLAQRVVATHFQQLQVASLSCAFIADGPLCWSFWLPSTRELVIHLHNALNHPNTPPLVLEFLIKHELLHLLAPPVQVDDEMERHHVAFSEREQEIAPERLLAWTWLYVSIGEHLRVRRQAQRTDVASTWKATWHLPRPDIAATVRMRHRYPRPSPRYM